MLKFSPAAQARWHNISVFYEQQMQSGGRYHDTTDFASKAAENIARVAAVLHAFETDESDEIPDHTLCAAINLVDWHGFQYQLLVRKSDPVAQQHREAELLCEWIAADLMVKGQAYMPCSHILQFGPSFARKKDKMRPLLDLLMQLGKINIHSDGRKMFVTIPRPVGAFAGAY